MSFFLILLKLPLRYSVLHIPLLIVSASIVIGFDGRWFWKWKEC